MDSPPKRECTKRVSDLSNDGDVSEQEQAPPTERRVRKGRKDARSSAVRILAGASRVQAPAAVQKRVRRVAKTAPDADDSGVAEAVAETLVNLSKGDSDRYTEVERRLLLDSVKESTGKKTADTYSTYARKWEWWLTHNADGTERTKQRSRLLLNPSGGDVATGFLLWLEKGAPGFIGGTGRPRVQDLSISALEGAHSMLQGVYKDQLSLLGNTRPGQELKLKKYNATYATTYEQIKRRLLHNCARGASVDSSGGRKRLASAAGGQQGSADIADVQQHGRRKRAKHAGAAAAESNAAVQPDQQQQQEAQDGAQQQGQQDHVWFPSLQGSAAGDTRKQLGLAADNISSKVSGPSRHVPSPADWAAADHAVAPSAAMVILPGFPHPVPLQSLLAAGFLQQPGAAAAGQQATRGSEIPAVAAATEAAVQAVEGTKGLRGRGKKQADVAVALASAAEAEAEAEAAVAAVQKSKVASVLPSLGAAGSAAKVWQYYTHGFNGGRPWEVLEQEQGKNPVWREGERKLWFKLHSVIKEVKYRASVCGVSHETAAAALDKERPEGRTFPQWVRDDLPVTVKERAANPDASGQQPVSAAATAAAQAAAAAATEALAAAAANAQPTA